MHIKAHHIVVNEKYTGERRLRLKQIHRGMFAQIAIVGLVGIVAWVYTAIKPPPPKICGSPNGPPVTATRVKLRDGRFLAYREAGVPKEKAKHKIIYVHGFDQCRFDSLPVTNELLEELCIYFVSIDRPGYGQSDPNSKQSVKSKALDLQDLADGLGLGPKFYVIGFSMGGQHVWSSLKYIPHRLAGVALLAPVTNYWWRGFPADLFTEAYGKQFVQDQRTLRIAHYLPWLTYWWMTQKWFPASSVEADDPKLYNDHDRSLKSRYQDCPHEKEVRQQGEFECLHRDIMIGFGKWDWCPTELENPFPNNEGSVHLWQGDDDKFVPVLLQSYIAKKVPWIKYYEVRDAGHIFVCDDYFCNAILRALVLGEKPTRLSV